MIKRLKIDWTIKISPFLLDINLRWLKNSLITNNCFKMMMTVGLLSPVDSYSMSFDGYLRRRARLFR